MPLVVSGNGRNGGPCASSLLSSSHATQTASQKTEKTLRRMHGSPGRRLAYANHSRQGLRRYRTTLLCQFSRRKSLNQTTADTPSVKRVCALPPLRQSVCAAEEVR